MGSKIIIRTVVLLFSFLPKTSILEWSEVCKFKRHMSSTSLKSLFFLYKIMQSLWNIGAKKKKKITLFRKNSLVIRTVTLTSFQFKRNLRSIRNKTNLQLQRMACKPEYQVECISGKNDLGRVMEYLIYLSMWVKPVNVTIFSKSQDSSFPK